jgi:hypothetical protein
VPDPKIIVHPPTIDPIGERVTPAPNSLGGSPDLSTPFGQAAAAAGGGGTTAGRVPTNHLPDITNMTPDQLNAAIAAAGDPVHKPDLPR